MWRSPATHAQAALLWASAHRHMPGRIVVALVLMIVSAPPAARSEMISCGGNESEAFISFRKFLADGNRPAPLLTQPVTNFLPTGSDAIIAFNAIPAEKDKTARFRIFETDSVVESSFKSRGELAVLAVAPVPDEKLVFPFKPADSTLIRFLLPDRGDLLWRKRNFIIIRCIDGNIHDWGVLRSRVSSLPTTLAICLLVLTLAYLLAMVSVWYFNNEKHPLADKYPAYQVRRRMTLRSFLNPIHLMADAFHRGSVQKFQVVLFSFLVGGLLLLLVLRSGVLIALSGTVVGLLGIVGAGAAVGQTTTTYRNRMSFDNWTWLVNKGVLPINEATDAAPRWRDLVTTNREFDVYKLQAVIFSIAVALALLAAGAASLASFDVPPTLLGILALSQGIFVAGVMVRPPSVDDLDKALTDLRKAEETARLAVAYNVDIDASGNLPEPLVPPEPNLPLSTRKNKARRALERYKDLADRIAVMIESTLETQIARPRLDPDLEENRRTLGPEGVPGGISFSIDPSQDEFEIATLAVWSGTVIDAIQITYRHRLAATLTTAPKLGGAGGTLNSLILNPGEFITRVEGGVGTAVVWMTVYTNQNRQMRWGGVATDRGFDFRCDNGEEIIGLEGRSGNYIYSLGAVVRARR